MREFGYLTLRRKKYQYDMKFVLQVITKMGKYRTPSFVIDEANRFAYENGVRWLMGDPAMQAIDPVTKQPVAGNLTAGLYVAGGTGTGKSYFLDLLNAFAKLYHLQYLDGEDVCGLSWDSYRCDEVCDDYAVNGTLQPYKTKRIICLHDFGSEPEESLYMGNRQNVIKQIVECRGDRDNKITLFTSNIPINHELVRKRYGDRVCSRLLSMCNYLTIQGTDRRKQR